MKLLFHFQSTSLIICIAFVFAVASCNQTPQEPFLWGVSSSAYQVEGSYQADGKGVSSWDFLSNQRSITQNFIGQLQTGNTAANMYDRAQYLQDIVLMKRLGINTYRFSIAWTRILPQGIGQVNQQGIDHYKIFIQDLKENGIEPFVTLYHFDMPQALMDRGGWSNPESVQWFNEYANVIFQNFGDKVNHFITFNEVFMEHFFVDMLTDTLIQGESINQRYAKQFPKLHHQLVASSIAIYKYHSLKLKGTIGITFNMSPCLPAHPGNPKDVMAAALEDKLLNRFVLDPIYKGNYPQEALDSLHKYNPEFQPEPQELSIIQATKPDFLGINFYAPALVQYDPRSPMSCDWGSFNPDAIKSANGSVRPDQLKALLIRLKEEYDNPIVYITENGSSFGEEDTIRADGSVNDSHRAAYLNAHIEAVEQARHAGADIRGYFVWSGWDNFEWVFGYTKRFGIIHVDFTTQLRTPKKSFSVYQEIIKASRAKEPI